MFNGCVNLRDIHGIFDGCSSLKPPTRDMFSGCSNLDEESMKLAKESNWI